MYPYKLPHRIQNTFGEELTFERIEMVGDEKKMIVSNRVKPGCGPAFHVHFKQDEGLTVRKGKLGYQFENEAEQFIGEGESVSFPRNRVHRFWNAGEEDLECDGWLQPANTTDYFLTALYRSVDKAGKPEGDPFDSAFLMTKYRSEYDVPMIPPFVKRVIFPIIAMIGRVTGKYKHFADAPPAVK